MLRSRLGHVASPRHDRDCRTGLRRNKLAAVDRLREHNATLRDGELELRPFTENDWRDAEAWLTDPRVLWFSEADDITVRSLEEMKALYRAISASADIFLVVRDGTPIGDGWVQQTNVARVVDAFGDNTARVDLQLAADAWGQGIGSRAIRALTAHGFDQGHDLVFGVGIGDYNGRSRQAFLRAGFVPWRRVKTPGAAKTRFVHDLICRPDHFYGRAPVVAHPGADAIRAGDEPHGATIVVFRRAPALEILLLHRAAAPLDFDGDWAWTPPAGARFPAEPIDHCAARELHEEVGLDMQPSPVDRSGWAVYVAEVAAGAAMELDEEHDRYEWVAAAEAAGRCLPSIVGDGISSALEYLEEQFRATSTSL